MPPPRGGPPSAGCFPRAHTLGTRGAANGALTWGQVSPALLCWPCGLGKMILHSSGDRNTRPSRQGGVRFRGQGDRQGRHASVGLVLRAAEGWPGAAEQGQAWRCESPGTQTVSELEGGGQQFLPPSTGQTRGQSQSREVTGRWSGPSEQPGSALDRLAFTAGTALQRDDGFQGLLTTLRQELLARPRGAEPCPLRQKWPSGPQS